ncbi:unnamed protein product, partial [Owenia fusiformis]
IMPIGRKINTNNQWKLGQLSLKETKTYKYLGVILNNTLKDSDHFNTLIKEKARKTRFYICSTLNKHSNLERFKFGDVLHNNVFIPAVLHACGVISFDNNTRMNAMNSYQYNVGRAIFNIKSTPARDALLGDLGWRPIMNVIDKRKIDYFIHLKNRAKSCKILGDIYSDMFSNFKAKKSSVWPYIDSVSKILTAHGLDGCISSENADWYDSFLKISNDQRKSEFIEAINDKKSLNLYKNLKFNTNKEKYLMNHTDFYTSRLKFLARTGCFNLEEDRKRWKISNGFCKLCNLNVIDDPIHRFLLCPHFQKQRTEFIHDLSSKCDAPVVSQYLNFPPQMKLEWILGDDVFNIWGHDNGWNFDVCTKRFLQKVYVKHNTA